MSDVAANTSSPSPGTVTKPFHASTLGQALTKTLVTSKERQLYKKLPEPSSAYPIDFASSDYLSFTHVPELRAQFLHKLSISPSVFGSGGSRTVINGGSHAMLENRLKAFFGYEAAVLCNSGYDANLAFFEVVPQKGDIIVFDEKVHASIHDGMKVSKVSKDDMISFKHNNMVEMKKALKAARDKSSTASIFVAVESLYSMDGTMAPLGEICDLADEVNGHVYVDEAHSMGVYGPRGRGLVAQHGVENRVLATLATFSKAINCSGAVILTKGMVQEVISNFSRTWIYTTCTSYSSVIAVDCCIDLLEDGRSEKGIPSEVLTLAPHFSGKVPRDRLSPVMPIITRQPKALSDHLKKYGITAPAITFPLVPKGLERVRLCFKAGHSEKDVELLVSVVSEWAWTNARLGSKL